MFRDRARVTCYRCISYEGKCILNVLGGSVVVRERAYIASEVAKFNAGLKIPSFFNKEDFLYQCFLNFLSVLKMATTVCKREIGGDDEITIIQWIKKVIN